MQPFILWQKVEAPYIFGILSNFKKVQIGYIDSYGEKVYFAAYYEYEDIADDYEPEVAPNSSQQFTGTDWNRYQERKHYKTLRENLNNSSNPEYTRPQQSSAIPFQPLQHSDRIKLGVSNLLRQGQERQQAKDQEVLKGVIDIHDLRQRQRMEEKLQQARRYGSAGYGMNDGENEGYNTPDLSTYSENEEPVLSIAIQQKLLNLAKTSPNVKGAISRGETVFVKQYFKVKMDYKLGETPRIEIFATDYIMIHKGTVGNGASYFRQSGIINENGDISYPLGGLEYAVFEGFNSEYGIIEKVSMNIPSSRLAVNMVNPIAQPVKIPPLRFDYPIEITFKQSSDAIDYVTTPRYKIDNELATIAARLNEDPELTLTIFGDTTSSSGDRVNYTLQGLKKYSRPIRELMKARADRIKQLLIEQFGVRSSQIKTGIGDFNAPTYRIRGVYQRR